MVYQLQYLFSHFFFHNEDIKELSYSEQLPTDNFFGGKIGLLFFL